MREYNNLPASTNDRISAFFFDFGIVMLVVLINIFMQYHDVIKVMSILLFWTIIYFIPSFFWKGQSIGKKIAKIKVVDSTLKEIPVLKYLGRGIIIFTLGFLTAGIYFVVSYFVTLRNTNHLAIHDRLLKTRVIRTEVFVQLTE